MFNFDQEPQFDDASGDEDESDGEAEQEDDDDMALAFNILDSIRVIYSKVEKLTEFESIRLSDIHLTLGDIALENENWDEAVDDYTHALEIKKSVLAPNNRQLAEVYFKISLAYDYALNYEESKEYLHQSILVFESKLKQLDDALQTTTNKKGKGKMTDETHQNESERDEINELLLEIRPRVCLHCDLLL